MQRTVEDLDFQLMELETRTEAELEQADEQFQSEQRRVTSNAQMRQVTSLDRETRWSSLF